MIPWTSLSGEAVHLHSVPIPLTTNHWLAVGVGFTAPLY